MPEIFQTSFPLRFYECDILGHLNNASYLKYMQETAFSASSAVGFGPGYYAQMGQAWVIRESKIDYLQPVVYGQELTLRTWVSDIRRVRSLRQYEFLTDMLVARAYSDWVLLNLESRRPVGIPNEIKQAYLPDQIPGSSQPRTRYPLAPCGAPEIFVHPKRVEWRDVDPWGHVNNSAYLSYIEDCGMQIAAAYDWPWKKMKENNFGIIARQHHIEYKAQAYLDDELIIKTWISGVRRSTGIRYYAIYRKSDHQLIAQSHSLYVWVNLETMRPIRIPEKFLNSFRMNIAIGTEVQA